MKTISWMAVTACLFGALLLLSVAGTDFTINMVGHVQITCPRGKPVLVSMPFEGTRGRTIHSSDLFGDQLPPGSTVLVFDPVRKTFISDTRDDGAWSENIVFAPGTAFWVSVPAAAPNPVYSLSLTGQVPANGAITNVMPSGVQLIGNPYPSAVAWTNMAVAKNAREGDELYMVNPATPPQAYRYSRTGRWGSASNLIIGAGMGFWYKTSGNVTTNVETRPYRL